jgi:dolichyl-phosphate beta-glucosyltransferase
VWRMGPSRYPAGTHDNPLTQIDILTPKCVPGADVTLSEGQLRENTMTFQPRASDAFAFMSDANGSTKSGPEPRMPERRAITVVVPCYNEAKRLDRDAFLSFVRQHPEVHLLFVNDGSHDLTMELLNDIRSKAPHSIDVLDLPRNAGKAEAVRQGLLHAVANGAALAGYWDADLATPLAAIPDFVRIADRMPSVEVVFGSRCRMLGHQIDRTIKRRIISGLCATLARLALRLPIRDTQCGAKLFRTTSAFGEAISAPFTAGWLFDVELFGRIAVKTVAPRKAFYELPLSEWAEIAGSKVSGRAVLKSGFRMLGLIAENRLGIGFAQKARGSGTAVFGQAGALAPSSEA